MTKSGKGNCFQNGYRHVQKGITEMWLVHGMVSGNAQGNAQIASIRYAHCWIEYYDPIIIDQTKHQLLMVLDPSQDPKTPVVMPLDLYYKLGKIKPNSVKRYNWKQALKLAIKHKHYGNWETLGK